MDESDLFAGIGADPARSQEGTNDRAQRAPDDSVPPVRAKPVALVTHEHLAAHALCHLQECPMLGTTAGALAEECLAAGTRFPHTLLVGPADSSKRTIARSIAADMAAPLHHVEMLELSNPDLMHAAFSGIPDGAVVLVSGIDTAPGGALSDLARVASARRSVRRPTTRRSRPRRSARCRRSWRAISFSASAATCCAISRPARRFRRGARVSSRTSSIARTVIFSTTWSSTPRSR